MSILATHLAVHNEYGFEVGIEISDDVARRLASEEKEVSDRTRDYICVMVREACAEKYGPERTKSVTWVDWDEIHITRLSKPVLQKCCDDSHCGECPVYKHERCQYGCTL